MPTYKYLIVGGGMTGDAAAAGIRAVDRTGSIGLIGAEPHPPYDRPPLSKGLWKGKPLKTIWRKHEDLGVTVHRGRRAMKLDPQNRRVTDDEGTVYTYEKLLLATGASPRQLPFGGKHIIYFRTLDDYQKLHALAEQESRFAVIGGGFIGSEIAAALAMNGRDVILTFPGEGLCNRALPPELARFLSDFYRRKGVDVVEGATVVDMDARREEPVLTIRGENEGGEQSVAVHAVVAGIGVQPNVELAQAAGLEVQDGIRVDASLRTSHRDIFAAGDVASFRNPALDRWMRVEHEDNANTMGGMAGRSMAGERVSYDHLPSFYSDLFELGYEAVGEIDARLEMVQDWKEPYKEGVVYYLRGGRVRGVLLWNVWDQVEAARRLITDPGPFQPKDLKGRLPA